MSSRINELFIYLPINCFKAIAPVCPSVRPSGYTFLKRSPFFSSKFSHPLLHENRKFVKCTDPHFAGNSDIPLFEHVLLSSWFHRQMWKNIKEPCEIGMSKEILLAAISISCPNVSQQCHSLCTREWIKTVFHRKMSYFYVNFHAYYYVLFFLSIDWSPGYFLRC